MARFSQLECYPRGEGLRAIKYAVKTLTRSHQSANPLLFVCLTL